ncbi:MAG TPA: hypothetical protein VMJ92_05260, partial [Candidatus Limnocylindrales bacterium]|nr:hypothetical protein [Candidatus Limnocylindrales bacterium]
MSKVRLEHGALIAAAVLVLAGAAAGLLAAPRAPAATPTPAATDPPAPTPTPDTEPLVFRQPLSAGCATERGVWVFS